MKRVVFIGAGAVALLGLLLVGVGVALGGSPFYSVDAKNYSVYRGDKKCVEHEQDLEAFTALDVDLDASDVIIKRGDAYHVHYVLDERLVPETMEVDHGTLKIYSGDERWNLTFGFGDWNFEDQYIEITIPEDAKITTIKLKEDAGDLSLSDVAAEQIDIKEAAGDITCNHIQADSFRVDNNAGDIDLDDVVVGTLHGDVDAGSIQFHGVQAKQVDMKSDAGSIEGTFTGSLDDYTIDITASVGEIKVDGVKQGSEYHTKASGDKTMKISTSVGEVEISGK